jgi:hypothetical protein
MVRVMRNIGVGLLTVACVLMLGEPVAAKRKKLNDEILKEVVKLAKDRESKFAGDAAMDNPTFQAAWKAFADRLDEEYAGHEVKLKKFGTDVRFRKGFSHILYMCLRSQTRSLELQPTAQEVVANHPFLQELILEGSCYTGGDPFPKKVSDLMQANPGIPFLLAEHLKTWDRKYKSKFEKVYPKAN